MTPDGLQNRFAFPEPTGAHMTLMWRIHALMRDGVRRSKKEIRAALNLDPDVAIDPRIRDLRNIHGKPYNDARRDGPDDDGAFRYQLKVTR